jgi:hypothetical protein
MVYVNKIVNASPKKATAKVEKQKTASSTDAKPKKGKKSIS